MIPLWPETRAFGQTRQPPKMSEKRAFHQGESRPVFGQESGRRKTPFRAGLYAGVSTHDQQTLPMQNRSEKEEIELWGSAPRILSRVSTQRTNRADDRR